MKSIPFVLMILTLNVICIAQTTSAQIDSTRKNSSQIYIETDPTALFFNGFSIAVRRSSTLHKKLILGVGVYKTTLPEFYIEAVESNLDKGWQASNFGVDAFTDYFIFHSNKGLSIGLHLGFYNFKLTRSGEVANYQSIIETFRTGYLWRPLKRLNAMYLFPWIGLSTYQKVSGINVIAGETFLLKKWNVVPAFQIGYSF